MSPNEIKHQVVLWDTNAKNIELVNAGATNIIGLTESAVYRFPITTDAVSIQQYEAALYKKIDNTLNVPIPQLIQIYKVPKCIVTTRLQGYHLSVAELASMSTKDLRKVIQQLLQFSITLNNVLDTETVQNLEETYITHDLGNRIWLEYLTKHLKEARFPTRPWLENLAHEQFAKWSHRTNISTLPKIVVHDDLHTMNFLFSDHRITGILDFGDCTVGTIAQELRQLLRIHDDAVHIAIEEYRIMTSITIDFEEISTWAVSQELAAYCRWSAAGEFDRPSFIRSQATLRQWFPGFQE